MLYLEIGDGFPLQFHFFLPVLQAYYCLSPGRHYITVSLLVIYDVNNSLPLSFLVWPAYSFLSLSLHSSSLKYSVCGNDSYLCSVYTMFLNIQIKCSLLGFPLEPHFSFLVFHWVFLMSQFLYLVLIMWAFLFNVFILWKFLFQME